MDFLNNLIAWMTANRAKILRYAFIPQALVGFFLLGLGYFMGHAHLHLIREGSKTGGRIVGFQQEYFRSSSGSSSTTAYMPIVEFRVQDRVIRFEDWLAGSDSGKNTPVIVLYDPSNPSLAMIDRPTMNWIPWAPISAVGLFLVLVALPGFFRSRMRGSAA